MGARGTPGPAVLGVPDLSGASSWSSTGTKLRAFQCLCDLHSGWAGAGGDGCSWRRLGLLQYRKNEKGREAPAFVPGWGMRPPCWGQQQTQELGANPLLGGLCQGEEPCEGLAWQHGHGTATAATQQRRASASLGSSPRCGGEHSLRGLRTAQPSVLQHPPALQCVKKPQPNKKITTKTGGFSLFPAVLP